MTQGPSIEDVGSLEGGRGVPMDDMGRYDGGRGKKKSDIGNSRLVDLDFFFFLLLFLSFFLNIKNCQRLLWMAP